MKKWEQQNTFISAKNCHQDVGRTTILLLLYMYMYNCHA